MTKRNDDIHMNDPMVNPLIVDCQGNMVDAFPTPDVHPEIMDWIPTLDVGDLVQTADGKIGLVMTSTAKSKQNVLFYRVMVEGNEMNYSRLQLKKLGEDK